MDITIRKIDDDAAEILQYAAEHEHRTLTAFCRLELEKLAKRIDQRISRAQEKAEAAEQAKE